jgi:PAS domain S-box-containing protein
VEDNADAIIIRGHGNKIIHCNSGAERIYGYSQEEILGKSADILFFEGEMNQHHSIENMSSGLTLQGEGLRKRKDGSSVYVSTTASPVRNKEGEIVAVSIIQRGLTEKTRAEEALALTQFAVERSASAIFWVTPDGRILNVNAAASRHLGYSREELVSMTTSDINPAFPREKWPEYWEELKRSGSLSFESIQMNKDGMEIPVEVFTNFLEFNGKE